MSSPWLNLSLADYETHMSSETVKQLCPLSDLFALALDFRRPRSVAILGIAGGNGLDQINMHHTNRIVGIDINPLYLDAVRTRYAHIAELELICVDLAEAVVEIKPVELVHAALVFEHAGIGRCLENALSLVAPGGSISIVLQLPGEPGHDIGVSGCAAMQQLAAHFNLICPQSLCNTLASHSFKLAYQTECPLPARKKFWMGIFNRP